MTTRWIVDTDGRGAYAVAEDQGARCRLVGAPLTSDQARKLLTRLRERDQRRALALRRAAGQRLAATRRQHAARYNPVIRGASSLGPRDSEGTT